MIKAGKPYQLQVSLIYTQTLALNLIISLVPSQGARGRLYVPEHFIRREQVGMMMHSLRSHRWHYFGQEFFSLSPHSQVFHWLVFIVHISDTLGYTLNPQAIHPS